MMFQKIFSELTLKLSGGLLLLKHQVEKLFLSFCRLPEVHFWEPSEPILWPVLTRLWEEIGRRSSSQRWRDITALNHGLFTSVERKVVCKCYFMGPPSEKGGVFSISFPSSKFSEICLIFARCQIITLLVNHRWLMISLMTMQSSKLTFTF